MSRDRFHLILSVLHFANNTTDTGNQLFKERPLCSEVPKLKNVHDVNAKLVQVFVLSRVLHTEVRWLSKGNMLGRLFELRDEVMQFLENDKQTELYVEFRKSGVHVASAYLSDIFESLNTLNLKLQGGESNIIFHRDAIKDTDTKSKISNHLQHLTDEFERYFPNSCDDKIYYRLATDPFHVDVDVLKDRLQEEVLEIKNDSAVKDDFEKMDKPLFWPRIQNLVKKYASSSFTLINLFVSCHVCGNNIFIINTSHYKITCYFPRN
ncbi:SCAN domain-containing protein 3-like [Schistocerca americana]|uniref:SCAN domain-containing protein 3-like n=1 Tax=Schistocerca americana TaxID=7009 RepID=UPI001F4F6BE1|nr:SCAN domain-containing protein 3-like [Schistocerca americana]